MSPSGRNRSLNENKKRYKSKAGWYSVEYPSSWVAEEGEECITFSNPESGVGALQISAYETPTHQNPIEILVEYLSDNHISYDVSRLLFQEYDGRSIASYSYTQGPWFKRVWFVSCGNRLLMITYNCKLEHRGLEDREVKDMVHSIQCDTVVGDKNN